MTASIVGWAHTPFGKLETETVESLIVRKSGGSPATIIMKSARSTVALAIRREE